MNTGYSMKNLVTHISEVPIAWIYKTYYLKCCGNTTTFSQPFDGRIIKVKSLVSRDTEPSLCFFYKNGTYYWKDFSTGKGGDAIDFVCYALNKTYSASETGVMTEYENFLNNGGEFDEINLKELKASKAQYVLEAKAWGIKELDWWKEYQTLLPTLNDYKVRPLDCYTVIKAGVSTKYKGHFYAFYGSKGPYQIYQPEIKHAKYIYINTNYLIGRDQLKFKSDTCIIKSGLKDILAIQSLNLNAEYVAGTSETTLISKEDIDFLKSKYKYLLCMLDNDAAGIRAMRRYKAVYGINSVLIKINKDTADNLKEHKKEFLTSFYTMQINKKLNE